MATKYFTTNTVLRVYRGLGASPTGYVDEPARVDVSIDLEKLFQELGARAIRNKSKRTVELGGIITAEVRKLP